MGGVYYVVFMCLCAKITKNKTLNKSTSFGRKPLILADTGNKPFDFEKKNATPG